MEKLSGAAARTGRGRERTKKRTVDIRSKRIFIKMKNTCEAKYRLIKNWTMYTVDGARSFVSNKLFKKYLKCKKYWKLKKKSSYSIE